MLYHSHSTNKCIRPTSELDFAVLCGPMVRSFRSTFSAILCERFFHMCAIECMRISFLPHLLQLFLVRICLSARVCRLYECIFIRIGLGAAATSPLGNKLSLNLDLLTLLQAENRFYIVVSLSHTYFFYQIVLYSMLTVACASACMHA